MQHRELFEACSSMYSVTLANTVDHWISSRTFSAFCVVLKTPLLQPPLLRRTLKGLPFVAFPTTFALLCNVSGHGSMRQSWPLFDS